MDQAFVTRQRRLGFVQLPDDHGIFVHQQNPRKPVLSTTVLAYEPGAFMWGCGHITGARFITTGEGPAAVAKVYAEASVAERSGVCVECQRNRWRAARALPQ